MAETAYPIPLELIRFLNQILDLPSDNTKKKKLDGAIRDINLVQNYFDESVTEFLISPIKKISSSIGSILKDHFNKMMSEYISHIVNKIPVDGLDRREILSELSPFFINSCINFLSSLPEEFKLSRQDIISLLNKDNHSVTFILNKMGEDLTWKAYLSYLSIEERNKFSRWKSKEYLPSFQAITLIGNRSKIESKWLKKMRFWLLIARGLDELKKDYPLFFDIDEIRGVDFNEISENILSIQKNTIQKRMPDLIIENYEFLYNSLVGNLNSDRDEIKNRLDSSNRYLSDMGAYEKLQYHWERFYARFYLFSGDIDKAIECYKSAFNNAIFRSGNDLKYILQDSLIATSYREIIKRKSDRKFLAHLKHAMILFDIELPSIEDKIEKITHKGLVKDWEVENWARLFHIHFNNSKLFADVEYESIVPRPFSLDLEQINKYKPDYKNVNKIISIKDRDGYLFKKIPQLVFFCWKNETEIVKKLLALGADVNLLSNSGESALSIALHSMSYNEPNPENPELIDILINLSHTKEVVNKKWAKKGHFPLYLAVETGKLDYVRKILEMGAVVDEWHSVNQENALILVMKMIQIYKNPDKLLSLLKNGNIKIDDKYMHNFRQRNWGFNMNLDFEDIASTLHIQSLLSHKKLISNSSLSELYKIVELLLEYGANPNFEYDVNDLIGYTPLMFSVENNDRHIFDLLVKFGGDVLKPVFSSRLDRLFYCKDIKSRWRSDKIPL